MQSPVQFNNTLNVPQTVERRRRGRGLDVMGFPTPDHHSHLPTPVTQRRKTFDKATSSTHLPTPQTLPRKRKAAEIEIDDDDNDDNDNDIQPLSPSGQTTFVLSHPATITTTTATSSAVRRRPGLLFAQQMGLVSGPSGQPAKFGARLGAGIGMGGGLRHTHKENPFLVDDTPAHEPQSEPRSPGAETRYIPHLLRPSAERSLSPHPKARPRQAASMLIPERPGPGPSTRRHPLIVDDKDSPFRAQPGEVIRARPTSEDNPLVTYVFRGAKRVFANPFVRPDTAYPAAALDPTHPEYDPHPCPQPRLLWPTKATGPAPPQTPVRRAHPHHAMDVDSDSDDDFVEVVPRRGLLFGAGASVARRGARSASRSASPEKRPRLADSGL